MSIIKKFLLCMTSEMHDALKFMARVKRYDMNEYILSAIQEKLNRDHEKIN